VVGIALDAETFTSLLRGNAKAIRLFRKLIEDDSEEGLIPPTQFGRISGLLIRSGQSLVPAQWKMRDTCTSLRHRKFLL
jgi:hypothetical protein